MTERLDADRLRPGTVYSLLGALGALLAPHAPHLPLWISITVPALLFWRAWSVHRDALLPRKWMLVALAVLCTGAVVVSYSATFGRDASVALLAVMLGLKVLELRTIRDATVASCLGLFLIVTNFLYLQSMGAAVYMLVIVAWLTATLISTQDRTGSQSLPRILRRSATLMLQAAPLMVALFLLFPRVPGPIFGFAEATPTAVTGLSETMSPGSLTKLGRSGEVAFRVEFRSPAPERQRLYWRGPVLWDFDGRTWSTGNAVGIAAGGARQVATGHPVAYTVTLEPHNRRWVFAIDLPLIVPPDTVLTDDYELLSMRPVRSRLRYDVVSEPDYRYGSDEKPWLLQRATRLPSGYNPKSMDLARQLRAQSATDRDLIENTLSFFRTQPFFYTLQPPLLGRNSVDEFLFVTRRGFCEHFASAFAVLMRAAGMPARVVTGYQGGEENPFADYLIVRQAEAHAWTEVWLKDAGWVRVDPTAAVAPSRIQAGIGAAVPASDPLALSVRGDGQFMRQLRFSWDAVANAWNQWVLGYTPERQTRFLESAGLRQVSWQALTALLSGIGGLIMAAVALSMLRRLRVTTVDPVVRAWRSFCRKLARRGTERRPAEGPLEFARRASAEHPALKPRIDAIAGLYLELRYARRPREARGDLYRLRQLVRSF